MASTPRTADRGIPDRHEGGFAGSLLAFAEDLREEGVAVGTSEILDTFAVLEHVPWSDQEDFKEAIAATLAKSPEDRRVFELVFDRFFFRAAEAEAARREITEGGRGGEGEAEINLETLRLRIAAALRDGSDGAMYVRYPNVKTAPAKCAAKIAQLARRLPECQSGTSTLPLIPSTVRNGPQPCHHVIGHLKPARTACASGCCR